MSSIIENTDYLENKKNKKESNNLTKYENKLYKNNQISASNSTLSTLGKKHSSKKTSPEVFVSNSLSKFNNNKERNTKENLESDKITQKNNINHEEENTIRAVNININSKDSISYYVKEETEKEKEIRIEANESNNAEESRLESVSNFEIAERLSRIIEEIVDKEQESTNSILDNKTTPKISIKDYLIRIMKYCKITKSTVVICLALIDRIPDNFIISLYNVHKIILACMLVSCKMNEDKTHTNFYFSKVGGLNLLELNLIEIDFLTLIEYNIYVDKETYTLYEDHVLE